MKHKNLFGAALVFLLTVVAVQLQAQQRGARGGGPPPTAKAAAPIDLTGYWISLVTASTDWRLRMITPKRGDNPQIPLTPEGKRIFDAWDPAKDEAAGEQCKSFGGANIMRMPGRLHITWADDNTLRVDTESGTQTRLFDFGPAQATSPQPTWQGESVAQWELAGGRGSRGGGATAGNLKVVTTRLRPGYLQLNGVPYSGNAVVTEYLHVGKEPNGDQWLFVTSIVEDPQYLVRRLARTSQFKKLPDGSSWKPTPCSTS